MGFGVAAFTRFALQPSELACRAVAREASEGWWARQDSNLQPDRYERPALTIELQAPPRAAAQRRRSNGAGTVYRVLGNPAMPERPDIRRSSPGRGDGFSPPRRRRTRPPCAIFRSRRR